MHNSARPRPRATPTEAHRADTRAPTVPCTVPCIDSTNSPRLPVARFLRSSTLYNCTAHGDLPLVTIPAHETPKPHHVINAQASCQRPHLHELRHVRGRHLAPRRLVP